MKRFAYTKAYSLGAAVRARHGKMVKAGGMDVVDLLKERIATPDEVLSIEPVEELAYIRAQGEGVQIGALATLADVGRNETVRSRLTGLAEACAGAATPQVRERATLGGNLCQRPRCWYFRNAEFPCLKKGGATCFAVEGENQYHAVMGGGPCHIVHPSNAAPPLVAAAAELVLESERGERVVPAEKFFLLPRESMYAENDLREGEILTAVRIPVYPEQSTTVEVREKQSFDWPLALASVARIRGRWRVCLGAVAPIPWLSREAMAVLGDADMTEALASEAGAAAARNARPMSGNAYKLRLIKTVVKRALLRASNPETPL